MRMSPPLYVERLILTDIRCFEHLNIRFNKPEESIVLVGDNGDGKSTVLRSLAMGICDQSSASALFRELHGEYVRAGSPKGHGTIEVELAGRGRDRYRLVTSIKSLNAFERVEQKLFRITGNRKKPLTQDEFPWDRIFASGYGPGIRVQGTSDFDYYLTVDAVYPLFRYDELLQNPELVVRRLIDAARRKRGDKRAKDVLAEIKELLARLLQLKGPDDIYFEPNGIYVRGLSGKVGLSALADGFRGTVTWVLDLIAWWFVYRREWRTTQFQNVRGIVLIDEVEQHLHPRWQRNIMHLLTESFPHVQFIATTHSPLVASGCEGIPVHRLAHGEHSVEHPFGWLAEDVYQMMGLPTSRAEELARHLSKFEELDLKRLRGEAEPSDLARLKYIRQRLDRMPQDDPVRLISELKNLRKSLKSSG
jgi:energy-coupling factor transporter ATP-binding protein EcfA2